MEEIMDDMRNGSGQKRSLWHIDHKVFSIVVVRDEFGREQCSWIEEPHSAGEEDSKQDEGA